MVSHGVSDKSVKTLYSYVIIDRGVRGGADVEVRPTAWLGVPLPVVSGERGPGDVWSSFGSRYLHCVTVYPGGDGGAEDAACSAQTEVCGPRLSA